MKVKNAEFGNEFGQVKDVGAIKALHLSPTRDFCI